MRWLLYILFITLVLPVSAQMKRDHQPLHIHFAVMADTSIIEAGKQFTNAFNEPFTVNRFRFYISGIVVKSGARTDTLTKQYYLIDLEQPASQDIAVTTMMKQIDAISFIIGVDSLHNTGGVQTGALDPYKGMYWTWNSGYVNAKLEGNSDSAATPSHLFSHHIGGYKPGEQTLRAIELKAAQPLPAASLTVKVDLLQWFNGKHALPIAKNPVCHVPGELAVQYADNYASMFSIIDPR
jgi:hypothetical protein